MLCSAGSRVARLELSTRQVEPKPSAEVAASSSSDLEIESSILRIEFDRNLHSRVVALFGPESQALDSLFRDRKPLPASATPGATLP